MYSGNGPQGFTIIEVLIFLTVSGLLFLSAVALIGSRQSQNEFFDGIHQTFADLQTVVNQTSDGYYTYENGSQFDCTGGSGSAPVITTPPGGGNGNGQGENIGCSFIGRMIQFIPQDSATGANDYTKVNVFTVVGNEFNSGNCSVSNSNDFDVVTNLACAYPEVLATPNDPTSLLSTIYLPDGINVAEVYYTDTNPTPLQTGKQYTPVISYLSNYSSQPSGSVSSLSTGTEGVDIIPIPAYARNTPTPLPDPGSGGGTYQPGITPTKAAKDLLDITFSSSPNEVCSSNVGGCTNTKTEINPSGGVTVCLTGPEANIVGLIKMGADGNPTDMQLTTANQCP